MKFKIKDSKNKTFLVEKKLNPINKAVRDSKIKPIDAKPVNRTKPINRVRTRDAEDFTKKEIESLKDLAKFAKELLVDFIDEDELDAENDLEMDADEEVVETGEETEITEDEDDVFVNDSKRAFGAIEKKKKIVDNSIENDDEIAQAWKKRYTTGGK